MSIDRSLKNQLNDYDIKEIAPKIYKINEYNLTTMFVIVGNEEVLVIDTGTGVGDFKTLVERLAEGKPYKVVLTHGHVDHAGGRGQFDKLYLAAADIPILKEASVPMRKFYLFIMKYLMFFKCLPAKKAQIKKIKSEPQTEAVAEGYVFDLGGRHVRVVETPGHTYGSIGLLLEEDRIYFSGDHLNPNMLIFLAHSTTIEEWLASINKIYALSDNFDTLWASHLSAPLPREEWNKLKCCAEKILKNNKHNWPLPLIAFSKYKDTTVINRKSHLRLKRIKGRNKSE